MKVTIIAGARPNFMKIAPIIRAIKESSKSGNNISYRLVHTGQHYDQKLSGSFFDELNIPTPDVNLEVGSGSHAAQTAQIMIKFEQELIQHPCDYVLVVGDVNSTMACAIVAKKLHTKVIHVEAGLRSFDLKMPEEINRMVTDAITDLFFTTSDLAGDNLMKAGIPSDAIFFVGNTMIDTLIANLDNLRAPDIFEQQQLQSGNYWIMTLHRPSNVDEAQKLLGLLTLISSNAAGKPVIFPVHPRTANTLKDLGDLPANIIFTDPLPYLEFMYLVKNASAAITDSGGIQEETTYLGIPCITLRENTERPETVTIGSNVLCGFDPEKMKNAFHELNSGNWKKGKIPELWDGKAAERIVETLLL
ncbi:MAG: UDP-N-acetyl glucosamine 2-epimerase [Cyclobacteriaceae bacterium]|nr:MAG: UDP-N-acetyl glucosamine 2-epimerase [Cyclobacteriaceae bacterium]